MIPTYTEEYFAELNKIKIETVEDASSVSNLEYLIGVRFVDDESLLEFETTRVTTHKGLIVDYRAPVLRDGERGVEEKAHIHIADIVQERNCISKESYAPQTQQAHRKSSKIDEIPVISSDELRLHP